MTTCVIPSSSFSSSPNLLNNSISSLSLRRASPPPPHHHGLLNNNAFFHHRLHSTTCTTVGVSLRLRVANQESGTTAELQADKIVDGMDFGELCNEFECISSPLVESTARQLVRDILQIPQGQGNRALGTFALSVNYKDPVRSFTGRDKYKRPLWATDALENPTASVQQMVMLSTSVLNIKWTLRGKPKSPIFSIGGDLILKVDSVFTLNQISGQVIEHQESWDLSASPLTAQSYFWASRRLFATVEAGKDVSDSIKDLTKRVATQNKNVEMYPDPTGDPTKFFQRDDSFQRDFYQIALFLAVVYFVVQYLRTTL